ncbi:hypothetical protein VKT23_018294 [Stygiomarasmius scandens]|uniref:F-box domain-containing protein n=1 Tax=Marasmiellus scandens TaxID=2682957 RepID=A0ABR1IPB2_9AGAR
MLVCFLGGRSILIYLDRSKSQELKRRRVGLSSVSAYNPTTGASQDWPPTYPASKSDSETISMRSQISQIPQATKCYIGRLPNELLQEIFLLCLPFISRHYFDEILSLFACSMPEWRLHTGIHAALWISHVCCRWRALAFSMPNLWSQLIVLPATSVEGSQAGEEKEEETEEGEEEGINQVKLREDCGLELANHYLNHSGHQPLELVLEDINSSHTPLINLLSNQSHRWHRLHLSLMSSEYFPFPPSLPLLEFMHLHINHCSVIWPGTPLIPNSLAPQLKELVLTQLSLPTCNDLETTLLTTSTNLVSVDLLQRDYGKLLRSLTRAPSNPNITLTLHLDPVWLPERGLCCFDSQLKSVCHAHALVFKSHFQRCDEPHSLARKQKTLHRHPLSDIDEFPNVHTFGFIGNHHCDTFPYTHFKQFIILSKGGAPITHLTIETCILQVNELLNILDLLPALTHLTIDEGLADPTKCSKGPFRYESGQQPLSSSFLKALTPLDGKNGFKILLPRLTHLSLTFYWGFDCSSLVDMIQSGKQIVGVGASETGFRRVLEHVSVSVPRGLLMKAGDSQVQTLRGIDVVVLELRT